MISIDDELAAHRAWLLRLARSLERSRAQAEDLVQDTYVAALRNAPADAQLQPWLRATMRQLAWSRARGERRRAHREDSYAVTAPAETAPGAPLDLERLVAALVDLPEPFHSTIVQRFFHGRSCAEIARLDGVPAGTVRWRQSRGLDLLRAELSRPRPRTARILLPLLACQQLVARMWRAVAARAPSTAAWLALAVAVLTFVLHGTDVTPVSTPALGRDPRIAAFTLDASSLALAAAPGAGHEPELMLNVSPRGAGTKPVSLVEATAGAPDRSALGELDRAVLGTPYPIESRDDANTGSGRGTLHLKPPRGIKPMSQCRVSSPSILALALTGATALSCVDSPSAPTRSQSDVQDPGAPEPGCGLVVRDGLVCNSCVDAGAAAPDCMAGACYVVDHCMQCTDPRGRVAVDCAQDYDLRSSFGGGGGAAGNFTSCSFNWAPGLASLTCQYAGTRSCELEVDGDWSCLMCRYVDGSGGGRCASTSEPMIDPMAGRPADLPAPGSCVSEPSSDGRLFCTKCTRDDLSATRTCSVMGAVTCDLGDGWFPSDHDRSNEPRCLARCRLSDDSDIDVCSTPAGDQILAIPVRAALPDHGSASAAR